MYKQNITPHRTSIANMLRRFKGVVLSDEDYSTTVKDILWNVDQLIGAIDE